ATVVQSVPYQAQLTLNCVSYGCSGEFKKVNLKRRINVTRISCHMKGPSTSTYLYGYVNLVQPDGTPAMQQYLPGALTPSGFLMINQAVEMHIAAGEQLHVLLAVTAPPAELGYSTATGTLDTLQ